MLASSLSLTHYWPHDGDEQRAVCGTPMRDDARQHSLTPTCPVCAASLAAEDAEVELATLTAEAAQLITRYDAAYEQWLAFGGPKPSRERFEDALEDLHARQDDLRDQAVRR